MGWRRWLKYGKTRVDMAVQDFDKLLDRKEAELADETAGKPWARSDEAVPTFEEARDRINERVAANASDQTAPEVAAPPANASSGKMNFELEQQQKAAADRLAQIRASVEADHASGNATDDTDVDNNDDPDAPTDDPDAPETAQ